MLLHNFLKIMVLDVFTQYCCYWNMMIHILISIRNSVESVGIVEIQSIPGRNYDGKEL
jgi:hypothetical protein